MGFTKENGLKLASVWIIEYIKSEKGLRGEGRRLKLEGLNKKVNGKE